MGFQLRLVSVLAVLTTWCGLAAQPRLTTAWVAPGIMDASAVAYSGDGQAVFLAGGPYVKRWDIDPFSERFTVGGFLANNHNVASSVEGGLVAGGGSSGWVRLFDQQTGGLLQERKFDGNVAYLSLSRDGSRLLVGCQFEQKHYVLDTSDFSIVNVFSAQAACGDLSPDGSIAAIFGTSHGLRFLDVASGLQLGRVENVANPASIRFSADGQRIAIGGFSDGGPAYVAEAPGGTLVTSIVTGEWLRTVAITADGSKFYTVGTSGWPRRWDSATGDLEIEYALPYGPTDYGMALSPDGQQLAVVARDERVFLYDEPTGALERILQGAAGACVSVVELPSGDIAFGTVVPSVSLVDAGGSPIWQQTPTTSSTQQLALSPDGTMLAMSDFAGFVHLLSAATGSPLATPFQVRSGFRLAAMGFSSDSSAIVTACTDGRIRTYAVSDQALLATSSTVGTILAADLSPNRQYLALTASNNRFRMFDVTTMTEVYNLPTNVSDAGNCVRFSPDGTRIAFADRAGLVQIRDAATGAPLGQWQGDVGYGNLCWSPNGQILASSVSLTNQSAPVHLLKANGLDLLGTHTGDVGTGILELRWGRDGLRLYAARQDGSLTAWNIAPPLAEVQLLLEDFSGAHSGLMQLQLLDEKGQPGATETHPVDANGVGRATLPMLGDYQGYLRYRSSLRRLVALNGVAGDFQIAAALVNGDVDGSNAVNIADFLVLRAAFGSTPGSPTWNERADLDGNGSVGVPDFLILRKNFGRFGD